MEDIQKKSLLEAILFLSGEPIILSSLKDTIEIPEQDLKRFMDELMAEYKERNRGILIVEIANGYQMITNPEHSESLKKFKATKAATKLSLAALETLAIIAYKQPMIKAEVEQLRSVNSDGVIKTLLDRKLIKIMGRKEAPGKPLLYGTTKEFLQYFGLKDLSELPTIKDLDREEAA
ncbi:MAG: SMC-Scp complex subunit ScpB [Nitrospiraceae bacterium]|nr:SMC-Scp complex subunit ScpB [Nitrospiraceae bacterium]